METIATSTVTSKGQILIPKVYRDALGLKPNQRVSLTLRNKRLIVDKALTVDDMFGIFKVKSKPLTKKEIKTIVSQAVIAKYEKKLRESSKHYP